jgi:hypothetical protein
LSFARLVVWLKELVYFFSLLLLGVEAAFSHQSNKLRQKKIIKLLPFEFFALLF